MNRLFPVLATLALVVVGMVTTTWGAHLIGEQAWAVPHDLWRTLVAAHRLGRLDLPNLYTQPTALITFPGAALILVPASAVIDGTGLGLAFQTVHNPYPDAWLVAGPYEIVLSATALFAADAVAERLGAARSSRAVLAVAEAIALWNVSVRWGHPEDAVAVALLLYGVLALADGRTARSAWLVGAAIAVQPLVLLGLLVVLAVLPAGRMAGFLLRAAVPGAVLIAIAAAANWHATWHAVTSQPNWPSRNHPTPWTSLAPEIGGGAVAAGPSRLLAVLLACGCAFVVGRRWRRRQRVGTWNPAILGELLWWVATALAFRCVFESVMVAYYVWPVLAVALVAASAGRTRLVVTATSASVLTLVGQAEWRGPWLWWATVVVGLGLTLGAAWPGPGPGRRRPAGYGSGIRAAQESLGDQVTIQPVTNPSKTNPSNTGPRA